MDETTSNVITASGSLQAGSATISGVGIVTRVREALENSEDLNENLKASLEGKPDDFIQMMIDNASDGLDLFKTILDPEMIEFAKTILDLVLTVLG